MGNPSHSPSPPQQPIPRSRLGLRPVPPPFRWLEQGFVLPLVMGAGLVMLLVATTLILKSRDERVATLTQEQTSESLSLAEGGLARILGLLNHQYQSFLVQNYDPNNLLRDPTNYPNDPDAPNEWANPVNPPPCFSSLSELTLGKIPADAPVETYTLVAYRFRPQTGIGTLLVRGQLPNSGVEMYIRQEMQIARSESPSFPGILAADLNLGSAQVLGSVAGNVICTDSSNCVVPEAECSQGQPTPAGLHSALGVQNPEAVQGRLAIQALSWPSVPTPPTCVTAFSTTGPLPESSLSDDDDDEVRDQNGTSSGGTQGDGNACGTVPTIAITGSAQFPRPGDTQINGVYHYRVSTISLSGADQHLRIDTSEAPVYFYLTGDLTLEAGASLEHICVPTSALTSESDPTAQTAAIASPAPQTCGIYGAGLGNPDRFHLYGQADDGDQVFDQTLTWQLGATITNLLIYAPDARLTLTGSSTVSGSLIGPSLITSPSGDSSLTGSPETSLAIAADIQGAIWVGAFDGSNAANFKMSVPNQMHQRLAALTSLGGVTVPIPPKASKVIRWERQPVP